MADDKILSKIFDKIDKISDDIGELKVTSAKQQVSLDVHIKRSDSLEKIVQHLDEQKIAPLENEMNQIKGIYKFVMFLSLIATIALVFVEFFKK